MLPTLFRLGVRAFDGVGRGLGNLGLRGLSFDPDALRAAACRRSGLTDFGPWEYPDALEVACGSLEADATLTALGRIALWEHLVGALVTRLQLQRSRATGRSAPARPPIVVLGLPRSGTTYLHRLLVELPGNRGLRTWEIRRPLAPLRGLDRRRQETAAALWVLRALAPDLDRKHELRADEVEECVGLFDPSLWTPTMWRLAPVRSYLSWWLAQDPVPAYRVYAELLARLEPSDARLVLKLPEHLGFVAALREVLPGVMIVQTHRDPVPVIASYNSLMGSVHGAVSWRDGAARDYAEALELWGVLADRNRADRAVLPAGAVFDVSYEALLADPEGVVRSLHGHFGLPYGEDHAGLIRRLVASRPQHVHGAHRYALEDGGLAAAQVRARFAGVAPR